MYEISDQEFKQIMIMVWLILSLKVLILLKRESQKPSQIVIEDLLELNHVEVLYEGVYGHRSSKTV
jgi:hypothetical protein